MYEYAVPQVIRVLDGDTIEVRIDLGFRTFMDQRLRLVGVDTPERNEPGWAAARAFVTEWLTGRTLRVRTQKPQRQSFERWLAVIFDADTQEDLSAAIREAGHG